MAFTKVDENIPITFLKKGLSGTVIKNIVEQNDEKACTVNLKSEKDYNTIIFYATEGESKKTTLNIKNEERRKIYSEINELMKAK